MNSRFSEGCYKWSNDNLQVAVSSTVPWNDQKQPVTEKVFWKYAENLQKNTHAGVRFQ